MMELKKLMDKSIVTRFNFNTLALDISTPKNTNSMSYIPMKLM